jgi:hypothetical protein
MKRYQLGILFAVATLLPLLSLMGCGSKGSVALGHMPPESEMPDPTIRQMITDMRTWVGENLKPEDAKTLTGTGKLNFTWQELQASYPAQATQIDTYTEARRLSLAAAIQKQNRPVSDRLAAHHTPDTVEIERTSEGKCRITLKSQKGIGANYLQITQ